MSGMIPFLTTRVRSTPERTGLIADGHTWTYTALNARANAAANGMRAIGIQEGSHIGVLLPTGADYVTLVHAAQKIGAVLVLVNMRLTVAEMDAQLRIAACPTVFCNGVTRAVVEALQVPTLTRTMDELLRSDSAEPPPPDITLDDPCAIVFTSGTTGTPKGAMLTFRNFSASAAASAERLGTLPEDRWLCVLPLYHVGGISILYRACLYGICVDLVSRFDAERVAERLHTEPITLVSLVPTMLFRLLEQGFTAPSHLRLVLVGGAATTPQLLERARSANIPIATTYGMSEATSQIATALPATALHKPGTVGSALPFVQVRVVREDGSDATPDETGEILVRGEIVMQGYFGNAEATAKTLYGGWLHTGDIGRFDAEGDLFVLERRTDLIISGGENVYPAEVEALLLSHPQVTQALVVGVPDAEWGQVVGALIVAEGDLNEEQIREFCEDKLARYKQPRRVRFVDSLPLTPNGKPLRAEARKRFGDGSEK